ncbi:MAG TPA: alpha/beta fold hydrolase [Myxococcales bacterium]|nr:alpha/beta fold hydrolase [Myxococcales bacterium]
MHFALLHQGRPALLRVEGPAGAPVALFFHPFPLHADAWTDMLAACAASGLCAAALDAPGFGGTPARGEPLTMDTLAELGACALDTLGARRAAIVGCSLGGYAAMAFWRKFPDRMTAVALLATRASADTEEGKQNRERQAKLALEGSPDKVLAEFLPKMLSQDPPPGARRRVEELAQRATAQGIADALRGMAARPDSTPDLPKWKVPALVIAGAQDQLIPMAEAEKLKRGIPGARLEVIANAGHLPFIEQPRAVAPLLTAHLQLRVRD